MRLLLALALALAACSTALDEGGPGPVTNDSPFAVRMLCATDCLGCTSAQRAAYEREKHLCPPMPEELKTR